MLTVVDVTCVNDHVSFQFVITQGYLQEEMQRTQLEFKLVSPISHL